MVSSEENEFLRRIASKDGSRLRDGTYKIGSQKEYDLAKKLERKGFVRVFGSNGILSGFPWTAVELTDTGKRLLAAD